MVIQMYAVSSYVLNPEPIIYDENPVLNYFHLEDCPDNNILVDVKFKNFDTKYKLTALNTVYIGEPPPGPVPLAVCAWIHAAVCAPAHACPPSRP